MRSSYLLVLTICAYIYACLSGKYKRTYRTCKLLCRYICMLLVNLMQLCTYIDMCILVLYICVDVCNMLNIIITILWILLLYLSATHCD